MAKLLTYPFHVATVIVDAIITVMEEIEDLSKTISRR
jgi:hypothetical protein